MKTLILSLITILFLSSCDKEKGTAVCSHAQFVFFNQNGENVFSDSIQGHLKISDFSIYTPDGSVSLNYYVFNTDDTNQFEYDNNLKYKYVFQMGVNGLKGEGITYLKFGDISVDTIYAKYKERGNSLFISELYYNDSLIEKNDWLGECGQQLHKITIKEE